MVLRAQFKIAVLYVAGSAAEGATSLKNSNCYIAAAKSSVVEEVLSDESLVSNLC